MRPVRLPLVTAARSIGRRPVAALGVVLLIGLTSCAEAVESSNTGATSTTTVAPTTTTLDRAEVMEKIEELFGSGDLLGVELSIDSLTGEIVVYSDDLTPDQKQRIEEAIGEVTYMGEIPRPNPDVGG